jgi:hypothetical protein
MERLQALWFPTPELRPKKNHREGPAFSRAESLEEGRGFRRRGQQPPLLRMEIKNHHFTRLMRSRLPLAPPGGIHPGLRQDRVPA